MASLFCVITVGDAPVNVKLLRTALAISDDEDLAVLRNPLALPTSDQPESTVEQRSINSVVIQSSCNLGYLNGIKFLLTTELPKNLGDYDWIVVSNPDLAVLPVSSATLILDGLPSNVAVVGPENDGNSPWWIPRRLTTIQILFGVLRWAPPIPSLLRWVRGAPPQQIGEYPDANPRKLNTPILRTQYMVNGCIFAIRRSVLETLFASVEFPFLYGEELIIGEFLSDSNHLAIVTSDWRAMHIGSQSVAAFQATLGLAKTRKVLAASRRKGFRTLLKHRVSNHGLSKVLTAKATILAIIALLI